ncbi:MAG: hypothetical protein RLZZ78_1930 [Armatimonadota bacterium]
MPTTDLRDILDVCVDAALVAGKRTLAYFQTGVQPDWKEDDTPVTVADREAERVLRERILASFPDHSILGEEEGESTGTAPYRWVCDPIDGTKAFVSGVPLYGTLIGVEHEGRIVAGAIYLPALNDMVCAADGLGAYWNGRKCSVSTNRDLSKSVVVCSSIVRSQERSDAFDKLTKATYLQRTWGDAFGYSLVATGRADIMLDPVKSPWDVGPMPVIFREAGGLATTWTGEEDIYGRDFIAANRYIHPQVIDILKHG